MRNRIGGRPKDEQISELACLLDIDRKRAGKYGKRRLVQTLMARYRKLLGPLAYGPELNFESRFECVNSEPEPEYVSFGYNPEDAQVERMVRLAEARPWGR